MKNPLLLVGFAGALLAANQTAHAQGLFGVLEEAATVPVAAARDLTGASAKTGTEVIYLAGDGTETVYKYHPGARLGRKAGIMPKGKLGLLPSHAASPSSPETATPQADANAEVPKSDDAASDQPNAKVSTKRTAEKPAQAAPTRRTVVKRRRSRGFVSRLFRFGRR